MSRISVGGRVPRPDLRRDLGVPHTPDVEAPEDPCPSQEPVPSHPSISEQLAETLTEEHHQGQPIDILASRWGLSEAEVVRAITSTGSVVNQ